MTREPLGDRASALRRAFDQSFAVLPPAEVATVEVLLSIRVADESYGVRLRHIREVTTGRRVTALPITVPGLLGIAGFRGLLVPVYDLRVLLGYPAARSARWLGLVGDDSATAIAFDGLDGYLHVPPDAITRNATTAATALVQELVRVGDAVRPLVHMPSVIDAIQQRARLGVSQGER